MKPLTLYVFVSSTYVDLRAERDAVVGMLRRLGTYRSVKIELMIMEEFGARHEGALLTSTKEVSSSHLYVGIIGGRYGSGITEAEYDEAHQLGMRCLIYFKKVADERVGRARQAAFKKKLKGRHVYAEFSEPGKLADAVERDLKKYLDEFVEKILRRGPKPYTIEEPPSDFVGRRPQIRKLVNALRPSGRVRIAKIHGMSGVGKTALALEVARRLRATCTDAPLFINVGEANDVPFGLHVTLLNCITHLGGVGDVRDELTTLAGTYRGLLSGKRALIVLDDVVDEAQITPFVPPAGCALLTTSREHLSPRDTGATLVGLGQFEEEEACELLVRIEPRIAPDTARRMARLCGNLPLALRAAASLLKATPDLNPDDYVRQLRRERTRLRKIGERGVTLGVNASFNLIYERLPEEARRLFRQLAVFPASFDRDAAEACADPSGSQSDPSDSPLSRLVQLSLVSYDDEAERYRLHDLTRIYAGGRLNRAERAAAAQRHASHFKKVACEIGKHFRQGGVAVGKGMNKFDVEWENLRAGRAWAASRRGSAEAREQCVAYADALSHPLVLRRHPKEQAVWFKAALAATELKAKQARFLCLLGADHSSPNARRAVDYCSKAQRLARKTGEHIVQADALGSLGNAYVSAGRAGEAIDVLEQCLNILYCEEDVVGVVHALNNLGTAYAALGRSHEAAECYWRAAEGARELADPLAEAVARVNLGNEYVTLREAALASEAYRCALKLAKKMGDRRSQASALNGLGNAKAARKRYKSALESYRQALEISRQLGDRGGVGAALCNQGNALAELKEIKEAVKLHKKSLVISGELGEHATEVLGLGNLGHAYYLSGDYDRAIELHRQALALSRGLANPTYRATAHWNLAQVLRKKSKLGVARKHARPAYVIFDRLRHPLAADVLEFLDDESEKNDQ